MAGRKLKGGKCIEKLQGYSIMEGRYSGTVE